MEKYQVAEIVKKQRELFMSGQTLDLETRMVYLKKLKTVLIKYEKEMMEAVRKDMGRADVETYFMETHMNLDELDYTLKHLKEWAKPQKVKTPTLFFMSESTIQPEPYGVTLIISAWNFPILQTIGPMIGAIAAGNTCILKPAGDSPACGAIVHKIISEVFPPEYVITIEGGSDKTTLFLEEKLDYIFFTGSPRVGKIIMAAAAKNLVPVTLELGGKSPAIVDESADIDQAAKRIMWSKLFNTGQICVTVDHCYVHKKIKDEFIAACKKYIIQFYGEDASQSKDYGFIINDKNFDRIVGYLDEGNIVYGGQYKKASRYIQPTLIDGLTEESKIMQDEIFGPVLPILTFENLDELIAHQKRKEKPLALYFFSKKEDAKQMIVRLTSAGGVTINDCMAHGGTSFLPFGGVGNSGMGSYHGYKTFETFSHLKAVMEAPTSHILDLPVKYPPYKEKLKKLKTMEKFHIL
ncbi:MAG: aldehyde dehydrogenase family protein [Chitinophagaceae bacterium]|nr:aldehyde dehydrogenase family protein [Chitinophagaceae bacterium]